MEQGTKNITHQDKKPVLTNKEIYEQFKNSVKEYIDSIHAKNGFIYSLTDIRDFLSENPILSEIPQATFYRYIKKMHIDKAKHPYNGKFYYDIKNYDYADGAEESLLEFFLDFKTYNKTLYVTVAPHLGNLLSEFLNCNFNEKLFYSTQRQGLLACHYVNKKNPKKSELGVTCLTPNYIKAEIIRIAKAIKYNEDQKK